MADNQGLLQLSDEQRNELRAWAQLQSLPAGYVFRARLILALDDDLTYREITRSVRVRRQCPSGRFDSRSMASKGC